MVEWRSPKPFVGGSSPSWPALEVVEASKPCFRKKMKLKQYFSDCRQELKKIIWPTKKEVISSVRIVLISTLFSAIVLGVVDFLVARGMSLIFK